MRRNHGCCCNRRRKKTWNVIYYNPSRNTEKLREFPSMGVAAARDKARNYDPEARRGAETFNAVAQEFLKREVTGKAITDRRGLTRMGRPPPASTSAICAMPVRSSARRT